jgi:hypothetical protein
MGNVALRAWQARAQRRAWANLTEPEDRYVTLIEDNPTRPRRLLDGIAQREGDDAAIAFGGMFRYFVTRFNSKPFPAGNPGWCSHFASAL